MKFSSRILISAHGPKKVSISDTVTLGVEGVFTEYYSVYLNSYTVVTYSQDENYVLGFSIERYAAIFNTNRSKLLI